jgi:hypothetical protein
MKTYKDLYYPMLSEANRIDAYKKAVKGKKNKKRIKRYIQNEEQTIIDMYDWIENYKSIHHTPFTINDGITRKKREIIVPNFKELAVQHCVINVLKPLFMKGMYEHSYASVPNRGVHKGKKTLEKWIKHDKKNCKYVFKCDIHHFFQSIDHDILKSKLNKKIKDKQMLDLLYKIIDTTETGLPIGFYTSQWFSNFYLMDFDHFVKEKLKARHYIRYMDDIVILGSNKKKLHKMKEDIINYLGQELNLKLKNNYQVFRFDYVKNKKHYGRDIDFMGFRFFRDKTILRKSILHKAMSKAHKIYKKEKPTIYDCQQFISYMSWIDSTDTYNFYLNYIKPFVNYKQCKRRISRYERRIQKESRNTRKTTFNG